MYSGAWQDDCHPFNEITKNVDCARTPEDLKERDSALIIWGGSDIHPAYYNREMHYTTYPGGARDRLEWSLVQRAIEMQIPIFGVCRGAQMLGAAAGGWLIQNVRNHAGVGGHNVTTNDGKTFFVNSIHHQMMAGLDKVEHELVAWSSENRSDTYGIATVDERGAINRDDEWTPPEGFKEPEFVYFPKVNGYAIQWHPEGMNTSSPATQYILSYIDRKEHERNRKSFPSCSC